MAGVNVSRDEVARIVTAAHNAGLDRGAHVRDELKRRYPGIENATVRRNGRVYSVLDYLTEDLESYAPKARR